MVLASDDEDDDGAAPASQGGANFDVPLEIANILQSAKAFSDGHLHLFQYLVKKRGCVTKKHFYTRYIFIQHALNNRNPHCAQRVAADAAQLNELADALRKKMNFEISWMKLEVRNFFAEVDGCEFYCLVNSHPYDKDLMNSNGFSEDEVFLLLKWLEYIFTQNSADGAISLRMLCDIGGDFPNPVRPVRVEAFLDHLLAHNWIKKGAGETYDFLPRAIAELEPLLRNRFNTTLCQLCMRISVKRTLAVVCKCGRLMHAHCYQKDKCGETYDKNTQLKTAVEHDEEMAEWIDNDGGDSGAGREDEDESTASANESREVEPDEMDESD
ncbi:unnamed protein product, partial [Mesorhabditis spiculigera]